ncbi:MAG: FAD-dependent monooxygenase [Pseudomonadota bacterium]
MAVEFLVAGGGIGGLAAALALARRGHRIELLEQSDTFGEVGAGIQLGPNATRRLQSLGLGSALDGIAAYPEALVVRSAGDHAELARLPLKDDMPRRYGAPYVCVHRADLHALLLDAVRACPQATLHTGARIAQVAARGEAVCVSTDDARAWEGDALIGADGLWSVVRPKMIDGPAPQPTGHTAWRSLIAQEALPAALRSRQVRVWLGAHLHAVAYPVRRGEALNVVVLAESAPAGDARDWDQRTGLDALWRATGRCCAPLQSLLEAMPDWRAWTLNDRAPMAGPHEMAGERIALVGDAAHPMLPYLAQGAGMAIEDAVALADAIGDGASADVPDAFRRYADIRWQRNARVQARARRNGEIFHVTGPVRWARDAAMRALGPRLLDVPWLYAG